MNILVTGCAGFIGFHISLKLLKNKINIVGIDNLSQYYDIKLKKNRLKSLKHFKNFSFYKVDLIQYSKIDNIIKTYKIKYIIHLAAQAGVRFSIEKQ